MVQSHFEKATFTG